MKLSKLFHSTKWLVAYRINENPELNFPLNKDVFKVVDVPKNCWVADPFLHKDGNAVNLYCEFTNEKKSKSYLAYKCLYPIEEKKWHLVYEFDGHTSYPCIFEFNGGLYIIPETVYKREVVVLRKDNNRWVEHSVLLKEINAPDTTFVIHNNKPHIFYYEIIEKNNRRLHFAELNDDLTQIKTDNVIKEYSSPDGRPGGNIIKHGNDMVRVIQPGIKSYGEKLIFAKCSFSNGNYFEEDLFQVTPNDVSIDSKNVKLGIHTYNKNDQIEVIDILTKSKFDLLRPIKLLFKKLGWFGFGYYDLKKKRIYKIK